MSTTVRSQSFAAGPVLELAAPQSPGTRDVRIERSEDITVLTPTGALEDPLPLALVEEIDHAGHQGEVAVDLSEVIIRSRRAVVGLAGLVLSACRMDGSCCFVCSRATGRSLLRAWGVARSAPVFGSIGDALQAKRFERDGYGTGWFPASGPLMRNDACGR